MAHDVPLGCAPDEYDDLISGTCSHLPKLFLLLPVGYGPAFPAIVDCYTSPTRHSIFDHEERQIISVNVSVVTNNNSVLHFFGLRPAHVAIRCHFPDTFLLYGVV
ncbi:hypothetical protein HDN35_003882 [Escherichia coli]|nr:hypothetical protein [Escherichia coli]